jgi:hypothetical protein
MGYYAELEIERSIAEGDYDTKTPNKNSSRKGIINYLYKKGFIKEEDRTTIINSYCEQVLETKIKKQQKQCVLIQENFKKFISFVHKEFIRKKKNPQP